MTSAEIKLERERVYRQFIDNCGDFHGVNDYIVFGSVVSERIFMKLCGYNGNLSQLYQQKLLNSGIRFHKAEQEIYFKPEPNMKHLYQCLEALCHLDSQYTQPSLILNIMGAVLQEKIVVLHGAKRQVCFDLIDLILNIIYPLYWPYPVLPSLLGGKMLSFLDSPVPLLAGLEIDPQRFESFTRRRSISKQEVHISLDRNQCVGTLKYDLRDDIIKKNEAGRTKYRKMKEIHKTLAVEKQNCSFEKLYELVASKPESLQTHVAYLDCFQSWVREFYVEPLKYLDRDYLKSGIHDHTAQQEEFLTSVKKIPGITSQHIYFYSGQIVQAYLQGSI